MKGRERKKRRKRDEGRLVGEYSRRKNLPRTERRKGRNLFIYCTINDRIESNVYWNECMADQKLEMRMYLSYTIRRAFLFVKSICDTSSSIIYNAIGITNNI